MKTKVCYCTKQELPLEELTPFEDISKPLLAVIHKDFPDFSRGHYIANAELNNYRKNYVRWLITKENRELNDLEKTVVKAIDNNQILSQNLVPGNEREITFGEKMADSIANFGGSWTFIIAFFSFLLVWMGINIWVLASKPFDPYPFILLNLFLSCLAAIQAPIIMMSQNRQEQKDRRRNEDDFKVNLKAELEIRLLHEKIDHVIVHQNKRLLKIQEMQIDYLEQLLHKGEKKV